MPSASTSRKLLRQIVPQADPDPESRLIYLQKEKTDSAESVNKHEAGLNFSEKALEEETTARSAMVCAFRALEMQNFLFNAQ